MRNKTEYFCRPRECAKRLQCDRYTMALRNVFNKDIEAVTARTNPRDNCKFFIKLLK